MKCQCSNRSFDHKPGGCYGAAEFLRLQKGQLLWLCSGCTNVYKKVRLIVEVDLPATESCEERLQNARELLTVLVENHLGSMRELYIRDRSHFEIEETGEVRFRVEEVKE